MSDGMMIILIFAGIILLPLAAVFLVLSINRASRRRKLVKYTGQTQGQIERISHRGIDGPWVIAARYTVDGQTYRIKETAKLKSQTIKIGKLPIGQKKTFVLGQICEGDFVTILFDEQKPQHALILGNEGVITG